MPTLDLSGIDWDEMSKKPSPSNELLHELFRDVDAVYLKKGGVIAHQAKEKDVALIISDKTHIAHFQSLMGLNEENRGFHCMCYGDYAIELYTGGLLKSTIGFHHGRSIRYDDWNGDIELVEGKALVAYWASLGFKEPLEKYLQDEARNTESARAWAEWRNAAPKCFDKYQEEISLCDASSIMPQLLDDLNLEIPDRNVLVTKLLQLFGKTKGYWNVMPAYELVSQDVLETFDLEELFAIYLSSDRNHKTRLGLGRLLRLWTPFRKTKAEEYASIIPIEITQDILKAFESINHEEGVKFYKRVINAQ